MLKTLVDENTGKSYYVEIITDEEKVLRCDKIAEITADNTDYIIYSDYVTQELYALES